jgi:phospholipase/lecithinase/hemolysin
MFEFASSLDEISEDEFHPTVEGHYQISNVAYNFICKKYNIEVI